MDALAWPVRGARRYGWIVGTDGAWFRRWVRKLGRLKGDVEGVVIECVEGMLLRWVEELYQHCYRNTLKKGLHSL